MGGEHREHLRSDQTRPLIHVQIPHVSSGQKYEHRLSTTLIYQGPTLIQNSPSEIRSVTTYIIRGYGQVAWPKLGYLILNLLKNASELDSRCDLSSLLEPVLWLNPNHNRVMITISL